MSLWLTIKDIFGGGCHPADRLSTGPAAQRAAFSEEGFCPAAELLLGVRKCGEPYYWFEICGYSELQHAGAKACGGAEAH
jgi:hypothetical protein